MFSRTLLLAVTLAATVTLEAVAPAPQRPAPRVWLHAHNCYPEGGRWADRLARALGTGRRPIAIEQDVVYRPGPDGGVSVVAHETELQGDEPSLEDHFFRQISPLIERALAEDRRASWPLFTLHLDFKTNERAHHEAIWRLLGKYERWLTTAERAADASTAQPLTPGPVLVLTEDGEGQAETFHERVPVGGRLRIFGTLPPPALTESGDREARMNAVFDAGPEVLIPGRATNYRRWTNFAWAAVERGGQAQAGAWTPGDDARLRTIVDRAHAMGLWVRFYTLNGHAPAAGLGWTESYNFGSLDAVRPRWRAAIGAGVDFIATDQYEALAQALSASTSIQR